MSRLYIDGEPVSAMRLERAVRVILDGISRSVESGAGPLTLATDNPFVTIAAMLAAERMSRGLILSADMPGTGPVIGADSSGDPCVADTSRAAIDYPDDLCAIFLTSGTSGRPKHVALSNQAVRYQRSATARHLGITAEDRLLLPLPLNHAYGYSVLQVWRATGADLFIETRFRIQGILARIRDNRITVMDGVPSMYRLLAAVAARDPVARATLIAPRLRGCGGDVLSSALAAIFANGFGAPLHDGYGLTEAGPNVALSSPEFLRPGTAGRLLDGTSVRIAPANGEIQVLGPGIMLGYLDSESGCESRSAFTADGWLRTGDTGHLSPDGYLTVTGRIKDVIVVHGQTFAPSLLEDVIREIPGVIDVAAVGVPGSRNGDVIHAFVEVTQLGGTELRDAVRTACRVGVPPQMRPDVLHVISAMPKTRTGKCDRIALCLQARESAAPDGDTR